MSHQFYVALGWIAPYYNIIFGAIALFMFYRLFSMKRRKDIFITPWYYLYLAILMFMIETVLAILYGWSIYIVPHFVFGILEMIMVTSFTYMLFLQREYIKRGSR